MEGFDYRVATEPEDAELDTVMNNSFGFGGNGASFIFRK
jgi:3-oxoacyl-(acyl-carrier-protein) synthase